MIGGVYEETFENDDWPPYGGMLIYDFKERTWKHRNTRLGTWMKGVVNHLAFEDPFRGYIFGFGGTGGARDVCEFWY